jgi:hypothetical protein
VHQGDTSSYVRYGVLNNLKQRFLTCGPRTPGGPRRLPGCPRLFRKLNNFSQQINKGKKAKSEIENFKMLCKSEGI